MNLAIPNTVRLKMTSALIAADSRLTSRILTRQHDKAVFFFPNDLIEKITITEVLR
jgi:hypothetical protein